MAGLNDDPTIPMMPNDAYLGIIGTCRNLYDIMGHNAACKLNLEPPTRYSLNVIVYLRLRFLLIDFDFALFSVPTPMRIYVLGISIVTGTRVPCKERTTMQNSNILKGVPTCPQKLITSTSMRCHPQALAALVY